MEEEILKDINEVILKEGDILIPEIDFNANKWRYGRVTLGYCCNSCKKIGRGLHMIGEDGYVITSASNYEFIQVTKAKKYGQ